MRFLVTGAGGLIGRSVGAGLRDARHEVFGIDIAPSDGVESADVTDLECLLEVFASHRPDRVVHLAYLLGDKTEADPILAARVNVLGTTNVFEAARQAGVDRFVYASSIAVYGSQPDFGDDFVSEEVHGRPDIMYGWMKQMNEATANLYETRFGMRSIGLRISTVFDIDRSAGQSAGYSKMLQAAAEGLRYQTPLAPSMEADLIHTQDVASSLVLLSLAANPQHSIYNSGGSLVTAGELANALNAIAPEAEISCSPAGESIKHISRVDWRRFREEFSITRMPLKERLEDEIVAFKRRGAQDAPTAARGGVA